MHATRFIGVMKITGDFTLNLRVPVYISEGESNGGLAYPKAEIVHTEGFTYYVQNTKTDFSYGIVVLSVKKECYTYLYFTVTHNGGNAEKDFISEAEAELSAVAAEECVVV